MSNVCCQEFSGWCKAFTRTERLLSILEAILLLIFISFLTFLILHLIICPKPETPYHYEDTTLPSTSETTYESTRPSRQTLSSDVKCTWKRSEKTKASTRYYEYGLPPVPTQVTDNPVGPSETPSGDSVVDMPGVEESDGEEPEEGFEKFVMALVKIEPMRDITFGCILTIVSEYWTLTAASCIEAVEEVDSLDSFVMMEGYGAGGGRTHALRDARLHPRARDRTLGAAALRSADRLAPGPRGYLPMPTMLDYLLLTIGERLSILGYGRFRTVDRSALGRSVRQVYIYSLPPQACAAPEAEEAGALRHLAAPAPLHAGGCAGAGGVCAGPLHARGLPCNYCAGTPLLARGRLLGVMADGQQCGVSCEPAQYVNLAAIRDWIDAVLSDEMP